MGSTASPLSSAPAPSPPPSPPKAPTSIAGLYTHVGNVYVETNGTMLTATKNAKPVSQDVRQKVLDAYVPRVTKSDGAFITVREWLGCWQECRYDAFTYEGQGSDDSKRRSKLTCLDLAAPWRSTEENLRLYLNIFLWGEVDVHALEATGLEDALDPQELTVGEARQLWASLWRCGAIAEDQVCAKCKHVHHLPAPNTNPMQPPSIVHNHPFTTGLACRASCCCQEARGHHALTPSPPKEGVLYLIV